MCNRGASPQATQNLGPDENHAAAGQPSKCPASQAWIDEGSRIRASRIEAQRADRRLAARGRRFARVAPVGDQPGPPNVVRWSPSDAPRSRCLQQVEGMA